MRIDCTIEARRTKKWEGGYANVANDKGGETYAGISRKYWPKWVGWKIIDTHKPIRNGQFIEDVSVSENVRLFYLNEFWYKMKGDQINSQRVANFIFDWYVNSGKAAIINVQDIVKAAKDGLVGNDTVSKINAQNEDNLIFALKAQRMMFVENIIRNDTSQSKFKKGWFNRINSFK